MVLLRQCSRNLALLLLGHPAFLLQVSHCAVAMCFHVCLGSLPRTCEDGNHYTLGTWHNLRLLQMSIKCLSNDLGLD